MCTISTEVRDENKRKNNERDMTVVNVSNKQSGHAHADNKPEHSE